MFESFEGTPLRLFIILFSSIYGILFVFMVRRNRLFSERMRNILGFSSASERAEKFYKMLMKSLENGLINNIDDVMNIYSGITGFSYSKDEKRYYLGRRLRGFLVYMLKQDRAEKEILKKWYYLMILVKFYYAYNYQRLIPARCYAARPSPDAESR